MAETVKAFLPVIMDKPQLTEMTGVCVAENLTSIHVLERCGFQKRFDGVATYQGADRHICRYIFRPQDAGNVSL